MREHIDKHPQDCLAIIRNATGQHQEGSAERTLERLCRSVSEGKELICWLRYVWAFCMTPCQSRSLSSSCQAQLAVLGAAHSTGVLHSYDQACPTYLFSLCHGVNTGLHSLVLLAVQRTSTMPGSRIVI